jgi:hypothetical protein
MEAGVPQGPDQRKAMVAVMIVVTLGGVTVGLILLMWQITDWWPGVKGLRKAPARHAGALLPFLLAWAYGVLGVLTTNGLIAWAFDTALWASNWIGDAVAWIGVGARTGVTAAGATLPLTGTGSLLVLILTACMIAAVKKTGSADLKRGVWCGLCLGTSSSVAGLAAVPLANAVNGAAGVVYGVFV